MENNFKINDLIICVDENQRHPNLILNRVYRVNYVEKIATAGELVEIEDTITKEILSGYFSDHFILAKSEIFKQFLKTL